MQPAPSTVLITCGLPGSASTFRRMRAMRMSMLRPEGSPVAVMRQVEQLAAAQDVVGMLGKCLQQVELHAGQRNLVALGLGDGIAVQIQIVLDRFADIRISLAAIRSSDVCFRSQGRRSGAPFRVSAYSQKRTVTPLRIAIRLAHNDSL